MGVSYLTVIFMFLTRVGMCVSKCSLLVSEPTPRHPRRMGRGVNGASTVIHSLNAVADYPVFSRNYRLNKPYWVVYGFFHDRNADSDNSEIANTVTEIPQ